MRKLETKHSTIPVPAQEQSCLAQEVLAAIRRVLPLGTLRVALHEPWFGGNEWNYVKECIDTGWVSSVGSFVDRFEAMLAEFTGAACAVAVCNGTAALHVALNLIGVKEGDEVLVPSLTFIATANAVRYCGAIPHFIDCDETTLGVDSVALADYLASITEIRGGECFNRLTGARIPAIVPMHAFGVPVEMNALLEVAARYQLLVVEDAAESMGSYYHGRHTGTFGRLGILSFNGNKLVTTGGGGAILTNDLKLGQLAKHVTTTARLPHQWNFTHDQVGFNYRLPNLNAALGCAQLEQLPRILLHKRFLAELYAQQFAQVQGVRIATDRPNTRSNYWLVCLLLDRELAKFRDEILRVTNQAGIGTRPVWTLIHRLPMYVGSPRMPLTVAEHMERCLINLPSSPILAQHS